MSVDVKEIAEEARRLLVHDAMKRIRPLPGAGPNLFTVEATGWGLSAPTKRELCVMLWRWFAPDYAHLLATEPTA